MTDFSDTMTMPRNTETKVYLTDATDTEAAPRIGKDLFLKIDVGEMAAKVHCHREEKVGDHQGRQVIFRADKNCTLHFTSAKVFGVTEKQIIENTETPMTVVVPLGEKAWTLCQILPEGGAWVLPAEHESPPKIIVP